MDAPQYQEMSYVEHVKRRREEKGCLYAWFVLLHIYFFFLYLRVLDIN